MSSLKYNTNCPDDDAVKLPLELVVGFADITSVVAPGWKTSTVSGCTQRGSPALALPWKLTEPFRVDANGGVGAGTIVHSDTVVWGRKFHYRQEVTEPEPGHILVETSTDQDQGTKFVLERLNNGTQTRLTISRYMPGHTGLYGWLERVMTVPSARGIYQKELRQIDAYMQKQKTAARALA